MNKYPFQVRLCGALVAIAATASARADVVAAWDFEEAIAGEYGVETVTQSVSSVNSLIAVKESGNPLYGHGADGVGHGMDYGILKVDSNDAILTGFSEFNISFDAKLNAAPGANQALLRYGVTTTAWDIYTTPDSPIRIEAYDAAGTRYYATTSDSAMHPGDGKFHHYEFVWDGTNITIRVDGTNETTAAWDFSTIRSTAGKGFLGIDGIVREDGSTGQAFNGSIDNIVINNTAAVPEPASFALIGVGFIGIMFIRRITG